MLKGKFIQEYIYKKYNKGSRVFKIDKYFNIRKSTYLREFEDCTFYVHNGRFYVFNDPITFKLKIKNYNKIYFKLGQFSYNKQINTQGGLHSGISVLLEDIKKKRGVSLKLRKKKKLIFVNKDN